MLLIYWKDLILKSRIKENAGNTEISFASSSNKLCEFLADPKYTRLIVDLSTQSNSMGADFIEAIKPLLRPELESIAVISHIDLKAKSLAQDAGFRMIIPRSVFVQELKHFLDIENKL
jgi:hypothetical protein